MAQQKGNTVTASIPVVPMPIVYEDPSMDPSVAMEGTPDGPAPAPQINPAALRTLGQKYKSLFDRYAAERLPSELRFLKNLRQYMGVYDPDIERMLDPNRSKSYPRITRVKCVSMLSRIMNLMFPGNEDNWELNASPSPTMSPDAVAQAVSDLINEHQESGQQVELTQELVEEAVRRLADKQAAQLTKLVKDQLYELGGDQSIDWVGLNRKVCESGIKYGIGVLEGPYVRAVEQSGWVMVAPPATPQPGMPPQPGGFQPVTKTIYKPQYDFLPVWDFYPDMSARSLPGEGYFVRKVLGRAAVRKLGNRPDFFGSVIKECLINIPGGNYKAKSWETELKTMGTAIHTEQTSNQASGREKYEIIIWKGPISARTLAECGVEVPEELMADDVEAELWMIDNYTIKAEINAWRKLGVVMRQVHIFSFDEDDTSPISQGLPYVVRDSALSIAAASRMSLDNASVTCGPNLEVNTTLLRADQDLTAVSPYKLWYRDDDGVSTQYPAVRPIEIQNHLADLQGLMKTYLDFAEMETFIGPSTGGDMTKVPGEPMRTAAGASMLRSDAALPFKDIVRNYDTFTQSVIWSLVQFNKKFNPEEAPEGDYNVIARGATSLIAKEVRGTQIDMLSQTLTPEERDHVDERKFVEAKFASRDMQGMLVSEDEAKLRKKVKADNAAASAAKQDEMITAQIKEVLSQAFKNVSQGQKNAAGADKTQVEAADIMMTPPEDPNAGQGASD